MKTLEQIKAELKAYNGREIKIMEVCGTHTASIFKNGIRSLISPKIQLISGPGCPVCVTPAAFVDRLCHLSQEENTCVLTFGDMMKVKGSEYSLTEAKSLGGNVKILYSPLSAISLAKENPEITYIFAAVGFETTIPIYALLLDEAIKNNVANLKITTSLKTILPALTYICENEKNIDAFLCPGHVSVITGSVIYQELCQTYKKPFVIGGFDGEHILAAAYEIVRQTENGTPSVRNLYPSVVTEEGNRKALMLIDRYFERCDEMWRGIGMLKSSGMRLREEYRAYDAGSGFSEETEKLPAGCRCQDVILGRITPKECPLFGKLCMPLHAVGPCMVSAEGACGIWYQNDRT